MSVLQPGGSHFDSEKWYQAVTAWQFYRHNSENYNRKITDTKHQSKCSVIFQQKKCVIFVDCNLIWSQPDHICECGLESSLWETLQEFSAPERAGKSDQIFIWGSLHEYLVLRWTGGLEQTQGAAGGYTVRSNNFWGACSASQHSQKRRLSELFISQLGAELSNELEQWM